MSSLTPQEAADLLGVTVKTLHRLLPSDKLHQHVQMVVIKIVEELKEVAKQL